MKETHRTRLTQTVNSIVCLRYRGLRPLAVLLCLISVVMGLSLLFDDDLRATAAQHGPNSPEKLIAPEVNLPRLVSFGHAFANSSTSEDRVWQNLKKEDIGWRDRDGAVPPFHRALSLDAAAQAQVLRRAPMEFSKDARTTQVVMSLPMPDGTSARFRIEQSPVMGPLLAARFPAIKTYRGRGLDDPTAITRFDVTPTGFHAIVLSTKGTVIIEPAARGQVGQYVSSDRQDEPKHSGSFNCLISDQLEAQLQSKEFSNGVHSSLGVTTDATLRTYRLALAATGEYTQTYGAGTVEGALSAMVTTLNSVNAIFERDLAIRLKLVDNEASIIFTDPATDGYTSDNATTLLEQNQVILDQRIFPANYDVGMVLDGHIFANQPGRFIFQGAAQFQSACGNGKKGKAVTIFRSTEPSTISAIWVLAHELAHQFGAMHTFNGTNDDCGLSRFAQVAYEPGSGSTIMGYRGGFAPDGTYFPLCTTEDLHSTDTYFHTGSIQQLVNYTTFGSGSSCGILTDTGNNPPTVNAGTDYTIPAGTPFTLTATSSDLEGDTLTYCWEEFDLGDPGPPHTDNGNRPIFRSFAPTPGPSRTFPQLSDILSSTTTFGESLPTTFRTMNFRVTVRDNHSGGGGVNTGTMRVNVRADSGPFAVTQPSASSTWTAASNQTVIWNVANTSGAPISCGNVRVRLSIDGGSSFPYILAASTPNNGSVTVTLPNTPTSTARIKIEAIDNIFFNISQPNFTINPNNTSPPMLLTEENTNRAVALDSVTFMREFFPITGVHNFSFDKRTRIALLAIGLELLPGEDVSVVTAQAEDAAHIIYPLTVEYVSKVPNFNWLTQVNLRLPDGLTGAQDLLISVKLRGVVSNKAAIGIQ